MTPTFRRFGVVTSTLGLALLAGPAFATTPDPRFSQVDPVVVGNSSGTPMGAAPAGYDVLIRDVNNAPVPGRLVTLDFSATAMKLYAVQNAGVTLDCASRQIHGVTNASGAIKFAPRIGGWENTNSVVVFNGGVELARVKGRSTDIDGADGTTGLGDFAIFGNNFLNNQAAQETDFDQGGTTGLGDFVLIAAEFLLSTQSAYCP